MRKKVTKAVFPVAGLGTRFLPATKANPKEMLPIVDKPLIQYAVEEAVAAGVTELIFVTSYSKRAIEDHFDSNYELESKLEAKGHYDLLALVRNILPKGVSTVYIRQPNQLGLGHAVLCARHLVGNDPFAVLLADDLVAEENCLAKMVSLYQETESSVLALEEVPWEQTSRYGIVDKIQESATGKSRVNAVIEKPQPLEAPSNLAVVGRYILTPTIFNFLENLHAGKGGEIQLTDAISHLLNEENIYIYELTGKRFDCGSKLGYLQATIAYALNHPEIGVEFKAYLNSLVVEEFADSQ